LSDGSASDFVDTTTVVNSQYDRNYTLVYTAPAAGRTLTVKWVMASGTGNVTLNAAALAPWVGEFEPAAELLGFDAGWHTFRL
jgi:hypothetical protein